MRYAIMMFVLSGCCLTPTIPAWIGEGQCMPPMQEPGNEDECPAFRQFTDSASGLVYCCPESCTQWGCGDGYLTQGPYCECAPYASATESVYCCAEEITRAACSPDVGIWEEESQCCFRYE